MGRLGVLPGLTGGILEASVSRYHHLFNRRAKMSAERFAADLADYLNARAKKSQSIKIPISVDLGAWVKTLPDADRWVLAKIYNASIDAYTFRVAKFRENRFFNYSDNMELNNVICWRYIDLPA
jgi:hypothetical protein